MAPQFPRTAVSAPQFWFWEVFNAKAQGRKDAKEAAVHQ